MGTISINGEPTGMGDMKEGQEESTPTSGRVTMGPGFREGGRDKGPHQGPGRGRGETRDRGTGHRDTRTGKVRGGAGEERKGAH